MSSSVLDRIETDMGVVFGVVDFVSSRHVTVFPISSDSSPNESTMAIIYKTFYPHMRFAVFAAMYFPQIEIGPPIMINRRAILDSTVELKLTRVKKRVTRFTK